MGFFDNIFGGFTAQDRTALTALTAGMVKIMAKIDDLVAQIGQFQTDVGAHLDALDTSIAGEITAAETAITNALKSAGATDAQVQAAMDALTATGTAISGHVDTTKSNVDAETAKLNTPPSP